MSLRTVRAREVAAAAKELAVRVQDAAHAAGEGNDGACMRAAVALDKLADAVVLLSHEAEELELRVDHAEEKTAKKRVADALR